DCSAFSVIFRHLAFGIQHFSNTPAAPSHRQRTSFSARGAPPPLGRASRIRARRGPQALSRALENTGSSHSTTYAHCHQSVTTPSALHLVQQRRRQLRARAAERMTERDGAAVDIEPTGIDRQLSQACEDLRGERLVQLDEIDLLEREAGL